MQQDNLGKFDFLLGDWHLEYRIPASSFGKAGIDKGEGSFGKILGDKYVAFEYTTQSGGAAKGIFAWDDHIKMFRYWWFENSGSFLSATGSFISEGTLALNWHDSLLVQTFTKQSADCVVLKMQFPAGDGGYELVLEVIFTRKSP